MEYNLEAVFSSFYELTSVTQVSQKQEPLPVLYTQEPLSLEKLGPNQGQLK